MKIRSTKYEARNKFEAPNSKFETNSFVIFGPVSDFSILGPYISNFVLRISCLLILLAFLFPVSAQAAPPRNMEVSPAVIDEKAKQRDIIKKTITLTNTGARPLNLFPSVEDVNPENGNLNFGFAGNADERSDSLANWIQLSRGVIELAPGETKSVPLVIQVNMNAVPGVYHAQINFIDGFTRDETQNKTPDGEVTINLEILADIKEDLQLVKFSTDRMVFSGDDLIFNYNIENIGNQELHPSGDIRIYDRKGAEVATLDVNKEGKIVSPEQVSQLASTWSAVNGFGQFKALITVNYGRGQTAAVQDTIFFWIIPWKQILGLVVATLIAMIVLAFYFHQWFEERHLNKLAVAGLLKTHPAEAAATFIPPFKSPPVVPKREPQPVQTRAQNTEPKERVIVRIAENIVIAWRLFTTFKQRGRLTPKDIALERAMAQPVRTETRVASPLTPVTEAHIVSHEVSGVDAQWQSFRNESPSHGETIDLKNVRKQAEVPVHEGHTVNLRKNV